MTLLVLVALNILTYDWTNTFTRALKMARFLRVVETHIEIGSDN